LPTLRMAARSFTFSIRKKSETAEPSANPDRKES
jgi:hypothetical protein